MKSIQIESITQNYDFDQPIKGYATVEIEGRKPIIIKSFTIQFYGEYTTYFTRIEEHHESRMKENPETKEMTKEIVIVKKEIGIPKKTKFYLPPSQQISSVKMSNGYIELSPGIHRFPIVYQIEQKGLPSTTVFTDKKYSLKYFIVSEILDENENKLTSEIYQIPLCYKSESISYIPLKTTKRYSDDSSSFELTLNTWRPSSGNIVSLHMKYKNKQLCSTEISMFIKTIIYAESRVSHLNDTEFSEETEPVLIGSVSSYSTEEFSMCYQIPVSIQSVVYNSEFHVFHKLIIRQKKFYSTLKDVSFDIDINCIISREDIQSQRIHTYISKSIPIQSPSSRQFQLPKYIDIIDSQLPQGIEQIIPFSKQSQTYYVNHFTRTTSLTPQTNEDCDKKYPFYESLLLPPGWSIGKINGQRYFIDHNSRRTTWDDPRCNEELVIPHSHVDEDSFFTIEILETKDLIEEKLFSEKFYATIVNEKKQWISTKILENGIQQSEKRRELKTKLTSERINIVIHFFRYKLLWKDVFRGEIDLDLLYIPPNTIIQDWFEIKQYGKDSYQVLGKVLLKICYSIGNYQKYDEIIVDGYNPLLTK